MFKETEVLSYDGNLDINYMTKSIINYGNVTIIDIEENIDSEYYGWMTLRFVDDTSVVIRELPKGVVCQN